MSLEFYWIAVALVTVFSAARLTRLATYDKFPPVAWLRDRYADVTDRHDWSRGWQLLAFCGYCASFWITGGVVLWGWAVGFDEVWWLVNAIFAASYAAAIVMANDGDDGDEIESVHVVVEGDEG